MNATKNRFTLAVQRIIILSVAIGMLVSASSAKADQSEVETEQIDEFIDSPCKN